MIYYKDILCLHMGVLGIILWCVSTKILKGLLRTQIFRFLLLWYGLNIMHFSWNLHRGDDQAINKSYIAHRDFFSLDFFPTFPISGERTYNFQHWVTTEKKTFSKCRARMPNPIYILFKCHLGIHQGFIASKKFDVEVNFAAVIFGESISFSPRRICFLYSFDGFTVITISTQVIPRVYCPKACINLLQNVVLCVVSYQMIWVVPIF